MADFSSICYKNNYLIEVVARMDFLEEAKCLSGKVLPGEIHEAIKKRYDIYEPSTGRIQGVQITDKGVSTQHEEFQQWTFHGAEREKTINISKNDVNVSLKKYNNYNDLKNDVIEPISSIQSLERDAHISRTGLRYINIFDGLISSTEEIRTFFSPMLSGQFSELYEKENCSRSFLITEYIYGEIKIRMQTGIYNPDYPARMKKLDFIIDIDAYVDTPHVFSDVNAIFDELHKKIQMHFESSITETMREHLHERA